MWKEKKRTMLIKVAIATSFRRAFPEEVGGLPYTSDEMPMEADVKPLKPLPPSPTSKPEKSPPEPPQEAEKGKLTPLEALIAESDDQKKEHIKNYLATFKSPPATLASKINANIEGFKQRLDDYIKGLPKKEE